VISLSRQNLFPVFAILAFGRAVFGIALRRNHRAGGECRGHPCQKQPSTHTATLSAGKTKSGRTRTPSLRRGNRRRDVLLRNPRSAFRI
jgi:hypothetical protein